ncbi:MAG: SUMF1/EgtB/PvdO family nonheme iron enzyme [Candidatus Micrarchaeota archaeon]
MKKILALLVIGMLLFGCLDSGGSKPAPTPKKPSATPKPTVKATPLPPSPSPTPGPTAAPVLSISSLNWTVNGTTARITWTAGDFSNASVEYATGGKFFSITNQTNATRHSVTLSNLSYLAMYSFTLSSCSAKICNSSEGTIRMPRKPCAKGMQYIANGDFCIDSFEASRDYNGTPSSAGGKAPWVNPTYAEAVSACGSVGKRLCTSKQFSAACNIGGEKHGNIGDKECNIEGSRLFATGEASGCISDIGIHDLIGNVREWVLDAADDATPASSGYVNTDEEALSLGAKRAFPAFAGTDEEKYGKDYYSVEAHPGVPLQGLGIVRGGDFRTGTRGGCFAYSVGIDPKLRDSELGFRCCS